jgi:hypothetical protein
VVDGQVRDTAWQNFADWILKGFTR